MVIIWFWLSLKDVVDIRSRHNENKKIAVEEEKIKKVCRIACNTGQDRFLVRCYKEERKIVNKEQRQRSILVNRPCDDLGHALYKLSIIDRLPNILF